MKGDYNKARRGVGKSRPFALQGEMHIMDE